MNCPGLPAVPPFLERPGKPPVPWSQWRRMFDNYMLAIDGISYRPDRQKAMLLHALGTEGQRIFYTLSVPAVPSEQSSGDSTTATVNVYKEALATLEKRYAESYNVMVERRKFRQRSQLPDESIEEYVTALRGLAITCNYGTMLDETLRDQLVDKALLPQVRERLLLEGSTLTLERATQIASHVEQSRKEAQRILQENTAAVEKVFKKPFKRSAGKPATPKPQAQGKNATTCFRCGSPYHLANSQECKARYKECFKCKKIGHFGAVCRGAKKQQRGATREVVTEGAHHEDYPSRTEPAILLEVQSSAKKAIHITAEAGGKDVTFLIDTGSSVSIISSVVYQSTYAEKFTLQPASIELHDYSRKEIPVRGCVILPVKYKTRSATLLFYVVHHGTTLLGLDAVAALDLRIDGALLQCLETAVTTGASERIAKCEFANLFSPELGLAKGYEHKVKVRTDVQPTTTKLRRLPLQIRDDVSKELKKLLDMGVIEAIDASPWVSPLVVAKKKDGRIRLCVDLRAPNKAVVPDCYPLPNMEELLNKLSGAKIFSKLDLTAAYHQLVLAEESRDLTAFITHEGLFRYKRLCFGLASAPSAFQKLLANVLKGCTGALHYLDDIIIFGKNEEEHEQNLRSVLQRISDAGLRLNHKCVFGVSELSFIGHTVKEGKLFPLDTNVKAILEAPAPSDLRTLRSFLGMSGHYAKFIKNYADVVEPLRELLRGADAFHWNPRAQASFEKVKRHISTCSALSMFEPALPVTVTTDASAYGLGAVLRQRDGSIFRTVSFASRALTPQGRKYSAGEREALACIWAVEHWHVYLWGRPFTLETDHQALQTLLSTQGTGHRPLRISRWVSRLLSYNFTVVYKKGKDNEIADALSRLPLPYHAQEPFEDDVVCIVTECISKEQLQRETTSDSVMQDVLRYIRTEWPSKAALRDNAVPFFKVRTELSEVDGLLLRGDRIVVPPALVSRVIGLAHEAHPGIVRTKQRLRQLYWWPAMDSNVETAIRGCDICQTADKSAKTAPAPLTPVKLPEEPWEKVSMDVVGPFEKAPQNCRYMITLIDYHSRWPEVCFSNTVTTSTVIGFLRQIFSREGHPVEIVTDNGCQFISHEFRAFLQERGIRHIRSSVYHPQGNGMIERFNKVLKSFVQVAQLENRPIKEAVLEYIGVYRATPHASTGLAPAFLLHGRDIRTRLNTIGFPTRKFLTEPASEISRLRERIEKKQARLKAYIDEKRSAKQQHLEPGDFVRVKLPGHIYKGQLRYSEPRKIIKKRSNNSFLLDDNRIWNSSKLSKVPKEALPRLLRRPTSGSDPTPVAMYWNVPSDETPHQTSPDPSWPDDNGSGSGAATAQSRQADDEPAQNSATTSGTTQQTKTDKVDVPAQEVQLRRSSRTRKRPQRLGFC
ncbi:uncharacterized protein K02A2.6-like [Ornithodoros turicata]|uniref:uncharacterized protein K02A2.6-like n=1 Tax=Ornithodoros turicata TaxID=34597 RepID=UPI00313971A0